MRLIEYKDRHELPDEDAVVIFDHIPKTGGITLDSMLENYYGSEKYRRVDTIELFCSDQLPHGIRYIGGHNVNGIHKLLPESKKAFYFTWMRHPLKRMVSSIKFSFFFEKSLDESVKLTGKMIDKLLYTCFPNIIVDQLGGGDLGLAEEILFERNVFFGITELYSESLHGLSGLLPWLNGEVVVSKNMARKDAMTLDKMAEEYFLEKNSKDMELYDKAFREFKKRLPENPVHDVAVQKKEQSYNTYEQQGNNMRRLLKTMRCNGHAFVPLDFDALFYSIKKSEHLEIFYNYCRKSDLPRYKVYTYFSALRIGKKHEVDSYGIEAFDIMDDLDKRNQIISMIRLRLDMIRHLIAESAALDKGGFPARCLDWLSCLAAIPAWRGVALNAEALLREKQGELAVALDHSRKAVEIDPGNFEFHDTQCRLLLATGALEEAESGARGELAVNPDSEWALRQLGLVLAVQDKRREAKSVLKKALGYAGGGGGKKPMLGAWKQSAPSSAFLGGRIRRNRGHCQADA